MNHLLSAIRPDHFVRALRERRQRKQFASCPWQHTLDQSEDPAIFIGGCGRSGTTIMREILNRHSRIACGPETWLFLRPFDLDFFVRSWRLDGAYLRDLRRSSGSVVRFAERFFGDHVRREGKTRWADKSPGNVRVLPRLLHMFPNAKFIHMIRDGRDVICSRRTHPKERLVRGKVVPCQTMRPIDECAREWIRDTCAGLAFQHHPRCLEVRYERLICDPEAETRRICGFLDESFEPQMIETQVGFTSRDNPFRMLNNSNAVHAIQSGSIGRWRRDLTQHDRRLVASIAGELLIALDYVRDDDWLKESDSTAPPLHFSLPSPNAGQVA